MLSFLPHNSRVIYGVLNWGLGHATRSIPLIHALIEKNNTVILAGDGESLELLKKEFPDLPYENLRPYNVRYTNSLWSIVIRNIPNVFLAIIGEHFKLKRLIKKHNAEVIISDSRFGFFTKKHRSYIISHQLSIKSRIAWLGLLVNTTNTYLLNSYDEVWVPDTEDRKLSGTLSINKKLSNVRFIGALSRMLELNKPITYDLSIILSGPEPSRSILEQKLINVLKGSEFRICLVRGTARAAYPVFPNHWTVKSLVGSTHLNSILCSSKCVVSRAGYSSILDYYTLGTHAILIPTPGQSEQEYLGDMLDGKYGLRSVREDNLESLKALIVSC